MLTRRFADGVARHLIPRAAFRPYPAILDRSAWDTLPPEVRAAQKALGEDNLGYSWPSLPATLFMEFQREGNRANYEAAHFARRHALEDLVTAECVEDQGRFTDDIVNGIWAICEESFWGIPAHNNMFGGRRPLPDTTDPLIDLFAAETGALLAWTHYLLKPKLDAVTPLIAERIELETKRRIIDPFLLRDDYWWMGLTKTRVNNWNPWCASNCLAALLLLEDDEERRKAGVIKSLRILDAFLASYSPDGGCDEGTSYWNRAGGSLFDSLELLHLATGGWIDVFDRPLIREIGRYIYRMHISGDYFVNFADGSAKLGTGQWASTLYRYGQRIDDPYLKSLGASRHHGDKEASRAARGSLSRKLPALFTYASLDRESGREPYVRDVWLEHTQVMAAREREGTDRGLYLAAKGGHNDESHNHNDVGQYIVYVDGLPAVIDPGVGVYTRRTFGRDRYKLWTMRSSYHNLPSIGGVEQAPGKDFAARDVAYAGDTMSARFSLDIAGAYPPEAGVKAWRRRLSLERGDDPRIEIADDFELCDAKEVTFSLMTPGEPQQAQGDRILLIGGRAVVAWSGLAIRSEIEKIPIEDRRLGEVWGDAIYRILFTTRETVASGSLTLTVRAR